MTGTEPHIVCPRCRGELQRQQQPAGWVCARCRVTFPVVGGVPVLVPEPARFLSNTLAHYEQYLAQCRGYCDNLRASAERYPYRSELLRRCSDAFRHNARLIESLLPDLRPFAQAARSTAEAAYSVNFNYLRRDWSGQPECEAELITVQSALREVLSDGAASLRQALVLGAGAGRTAWDLSEWIPRVTAVDLSYTMAAFFHGVSQAPVEFFEINRSNTLHRDNLVRRHTARRPEGVTRTGHCEFQVADGTSLPFRTQSMDAVFSIYFTDVLPFEQFVQEVKRVLKPGGWLVHFGPLDYHFQDYGPSLSAEELRGRLAEHGLPIVREGMVRCPHLASAGSMTEQVNSNWVFAARNRNRPADAEILPHDVPYLPEPARYEQTAQGRMFLLIPGGRKMEIGPGVQSLLQLVDGGRRVDESIAAMKAAHGLTHDSADTEILQIFQELSANGVIGWREESKPSK